MDNNDFQIDGMNPYLEAAYEQQNYKEVTIDSKKKLCLIFFSSNGIYFPNTLESFQNTIINKNRYEWTRSAAHKHITNIAGKIIFVRDIYKTWYQEGINSQVNSIDKLCLLLKELTNGFEVITCGSSSGGYMAAIAGVYLNARMVFDFSGHWSLRKQFDNQFPDKYPFLQKCALDKERCKWLDIADYCMENTKVPIVWFYAARCEQDTKQREVLDGHASDQRSKYLFAMDSDTHGFTLLGGVEYLIDKDEKWFQKKAEKYQNKMINQRWFALCSMPFGPALKCIFKDVVRCHKSLQYLFHIK